MDKYDIIVVAGQSNAEGNGLGPVTAEYIPDGKIMMLREDHFELEPYNPAGDNRWKCLLPRSMHLEVADVRYAGETKVGQLQLPFARYYYDACLKETDRKVLVVQAALGGSGFHRREWAVEDHNCFDRLVDMTRYALSLNPENRLVAFLWHQGETDALLEPELTADQRYDIHKQYLSQMLDSYCERFDCSGIPMITAGFVEEWYLKNKAIAQPIRKAVEEVFRQRNGIVLDTSGLKSNQLAIGNGDDIHFSRESLHILGKMFFDAFMTVKREI